MSSEVVKIRDEAKKCYKVAEDMKKENYNKSIIIVMKTLGKIMATQAIILEQIEELKNDKN